MNKLKLIIKDDNFIFIHDLIFLINLEKNAEVIGKA